MGGCVCVCVCVSVSVCVCESMHTGTQVTKGVAGGRVLQ